MKILVINGDCVQTNSSANLCHLAYLRGLVEAGHEVSLLSSDGKDYVTDPSMVIPPQVRHFTISGISLYEKMARRKHTAGGTAAPAGTPVAPSAPGLRQKMVRKVKDLVLSLYGVHGIYATFVRKARQFSSDVEYDCILSISTPVTSHLVAHNLLKAGHIRGKQWIQIWEDPWYADAYGLNSKPEILREERRLLSFAQKVCYVSPLTLENQKRLFPDSAHKMFWQPLPFYYKSEETDVVMSDVNCYGYFGDYNPAARDLAPFYEAAVETGIKVNICGNPANLFQSTEHIHIYPRLTLEKLKPIEDSTNVLIFLCNRKGGQIPGKIYQYSATNKTILFIMDGTEEEQPVLSTYFGRFNRYIFCQNSKEDIVRAIRKIESGDLDGVENKPLREFRPQITISNILKAGE